MRGGVVAFLVGIWRALPIIGRSASHADDIRASQTVRRRAERSIDRWNEQFSQSWERHQ